MSRKKTSPDWSGDPDLPAARARLSLVASPGTADVLVGLLSAARTDLLDAGDVLHAAQLPPLDRQHPEVARALKRAAKGKPLSPALLVRGDLAAGRALFVADGHATASACCHLGPDTPLACRVVELPAMSL